MEGLESGIGLADVIAYVHQGAVGVVARREGVALAHGGVSERGVLGEGFGGEPVPVTDPEQFERTAGIRVGGPIRVSFAQVARGRVRGWVEDEGSVAGDGQGESAAVEQVAGGAQVGGHQAGQVEADQELAVSGVDAGVIAQGAEHRSGRAGARGGVVGIHPAVQGRRCEGKFEWLGPVGCGGEREDGRTQDGQGDGGGGAERGVGRWTWICLCGLWRRSVHWGRRCREGAGRCALSGGGAAGCRRVERIGSGPWGVSGGEGGRSREGSGRRASA